MEDKAEDPREQWLSQRPSILPHHSERNEVKVVTRREAVAFYRHQCHSELVAS